MALTVDKPLHEELTGRVKQVTLNVDFDASYPTGGEALDPAKFGIRNIHNVLIQGKSGYLFEYDYTNKKVKVLTPFGAQSAVGSHTHVENAAGAYTQSASTAAGTVSLTAAAAAEVANATDLSALTNVRVTFIGT